MTFTLNGYQPETEKLEMIQTTGEPPSLRPNPVVVELTPGAAPGAKKPSQKAGGEEASRAPEAGRSGLLPLR